MKFSQRIGKTPVKNELDREALSQEARNSLWTVTSELILNNLSNTNRYSEDGYHYQKYSSLTNFYRKLWMFFFKYPLDTLPSGSNVYSDSARETVRDWYFKAEWYEVLDFIEFCSSFHSNYSDSVNLFLKSEISAYRFIEGKLVEINSEDEKEEIQKAINISSKFESVKEHLLRSILLFSDRKNPDFRNSIKESISAVEALAKIIVKDEKTTLGQALKVIEKKHKIPESLKSAFSKLYGYTSNEGGIRHSLLEGESVIGIEEARFMMITCSAFINYLISKT